MKTIEVYSVHELSNEAMERAFDKWLNRDFEFWPSNEIIKSIERGLEFFGFSLKNYSIDFSNANRSSYVISEPGVSELFGVRLWKYINNNYLTYISKYDKETKNTLDGDCPFTGVCYDEDFLDPVRKFMKKPDNLSFSDLMESAVHSVLVSAENEYDYMQSDEYFIEEAEANEYTFLENGKRI